MLACQREAAELDGAVEAKLRVDRLDRTIALLLESQADIVEAIGRDFGARSPHQTRMGDLYATIESLRHARDHVARWMRPEKRRSPFPLGLFGARARIEYQPKGVVGILGTWNFPINTVFAPIAGVFAAGNRAMVKCSEHAPATAELVAGLVARRFDTRELACVTGGPEVGAAFAALPFDHLVFTGSASIGRAVMRAAAENLVPVTLELGGKSPVIVARDADLAEAAVRIMMGKALNAGQACLAPDYVFVPSERRDAFLAHAIAFTETMFPTSVSNPDHTSVIDARHARRLRGLVEDARSRGADVREVNPAREDFERQVGTHKLPFTFVVEPGEDAAIMQEEIFGPVLVVKTYRELDECIRYVNAHPRPLGLYLFSDDAAVQRRVLEHTRSGGMTINDVLTHVSVEDLPFGGIGPSGMGHYHGIEGFRQFSHARPVYRQSRLNLQRLGGMVPPYGEACEKNLARMIRR